MKIERMVEHKSLTMADDGSLTEAFSMRNLAGGMIYMPAAWVAANIGFKVCDTETGTFNILCDQYGAPVEISGVSTTVAQWYAMPNEIFAAWWVKVWSKNTASTADVGQSGGPLTIKVMLKG